MNIRFKFRPTTDTTGTIQCIINVNAKEATAFSTFIKCSREDWDVKKYRIKGRSAQADADNLKLDSLISELTRTYLALTQQNVMVTAEYLKGLATGKIATDYQVDYLIDTIVR